jgi:hypothetical protein
MILVVKTLNRPQVLFISGLPTWLDQGGGHLHHGVVLGSRPSELFLELALRLIWQHPLYIYISLVTKFLISSINYTTVINGLKTIITCSILLMCLTCFSPIRPIQELKHYK